MDLDWLSVGQIQEDIELIKESLERNGPNFVDRHFYEQMLEEQYSELERLQIGRVTSDVIAPARYPSQRTAQGYQAYSTLNQTSATKDGLNTHSVPRNASRGERARSMSTRSPLLTSQRSDSPYPCADHTNAPQDHDQDPSRSASYQVQQHKPMNDQQTPRNRLRQRLREYRQNDIPSSQYLNETRAPAQCEQPCVGYPDDNKDDAESDFEFDFSKEEPEPRQTFSRNARSLKGTVPLDRFLLEPLDSINSLFVEMMSTKSPAPGHQEMTQLINDEEDRQSVRSIESSTTLVSTLSGYTAVDIASATWELRRVLQDLNLVKLYRLAAEHPDIGHERLRRNLGRLLKQMAQDLKIEANKDLEKLTSRFVAIKARTLAHSIVDDLRNTQPEARQQKIGEAPDERPERAHGEIFEESESDRENNSIDENRFEDLTIFRTFLVESDAFQMFQSRLAAFITPETGQTIEAQAKGVAANPEIWIPKSPVSLKWFNIIHIAILGALGIVESQISTNAIRLNWNCKCGDVFFSDMYEYRPGGVQRLKERMQRSGCRNISITTCNQQSQHRGLTLQVPPWLRAIRRKVSVSLTALRKDSLDDICLPRHQTSNFAQDSKAPEPHGPVSQPDLYLMSCIHRTQHHIEVSQDLLNITSDRQLFHFLRRQIKLYRGSFRSLLSMRRVQGIFFIKFRLHKNSVAQVRHHRYCCTQSTCECIPPQSKVIKPPMGSGEYDCNPSGPPDTWPPVCPEFMMHMFHSPACIAEDDTSILEQIPKKMDCKLDEKGASLPEGWGLYFQEDIDVSGVVAVVFVALGAASLAFLIVWTVCKDDIQGASGVGAYIVAVASMVGIWIATKSRSFG